MKEIESVLSIYGSHDASVTFVDKHNELKVLEYERLVNQRYGAFTTSMSHRKGLGTTDTQRDIFMKYIQNQVKTDIKTILYNEISKADMDFIGNYFPEAEFEKMEHHRSHAACGFYQSGFERAIILSIDGGGHDIDGVTYTKSFLAEDDNIDVIKKYQTNLGGAYGRIGCPISEIKPGPDSDTDSLVYAGKVMGLCAYGKVRKEWLQPMREFYGHKDLNKLGNAIGLKLSLNSLEGQDSYDLAAASQHIFEELTFQIVISLIDDYGEYDVVLVGGCALNVLFNQKLYEHLNKINRKLYVPPNPNDCGLSLGQFLLKFPQKVDDIQYNGFELLDADKLDFYVKDRNARKIETSEIVKLLKTGNLVGLVSSCSEIGPRALGNRSIICDPSFPNMKDILNSKVKFREWYRPFAPVARLENASDYFNDVFESKYMSFAPTVKDEYIEDLKSVTHVDKTSRLQTVTENQHKKFYDILKELENQGHVSVILNTSFNILGNPILTTIKDALHVLDNTELDYVIVDNFLFGDEIHE